MLKLDEQQDTVRLSVSLTKAVYEKVKRLHPGNVSYGLRTLIEKALDK